MGKDKKLANNENKETVFYYEIIGLAFILISFISISRLGVIGIYFGLIFKLIFGQFYFLFIILLFCNGLFLIIKHQFINYKNMQFIGLCLFLISLLILSHFSYHDYIDSYNQNNLKLTLSFYIDGFKNKDFESLNGGGLIGSVIFYVFYFLLGRFGSFIIPIILLYISFAFINKKTVIEFTNLWFNKIRYIFNKSKRFKNIFKYEIVKNNTLIKINEHNLQEIKNNEEIEFCNVLYKEVVEYLKDYQYVYDKIDIIKSNHLIIVSVLFKYHLDIKELYYYLKEKSNFFFLLRYDIIKNKTTIYLEFNKRIPCCYSYKESFRNSNKYEIILGINGFNKDIKYYIDDHLLIVGDKQIEYFFSICLLLQNKLSKKDVFYLSNDYNYGMLFYHYDLNYLVDILQIIEERIVIINNKGYSNYYEYIKNYKNNNMKEIVLFIDNIDDIYRDVNLINVFVNVLKLAKNAGIILISEVINCYNELDELVLHLFKHKVYLKNKSVNVHKEIISIMNKIEGIYENDDTVSRIALSLIDPIDYSQLMKRIIKK